MTKVINIGVPAEIYIRYNTKSIKDMFIRAIYDFVRDGRLRSDYDGKVVTLTIRVDEAIEGTVRGSADAYTMSIIEFTSKLFKEDYTWSMISTK